MGSADPEDWTAIRDWLDAQGRWFALAAGQRVPVGAGWATLAVIDLGELHLPSGQIGACDPFMGLGEGAAWLTVPPGRYPVKLTIAQKGLLDAYEAYLTLLVDPDADEVRREERQDDNWGGIGVDAGAVCFVDAEAARRCVDADWEAITGGPGGWIERLHDPASAGINLPLPGDVDANIVICRSGFGDGIYPVIVGYDAADRVVRVHIDLLVIGHHPAPNAPVPPAPPRRRYLAIALMSGPTLVLVGVVAVLHAPVEIAVFGSLAWAMFALALSLRLGWTTW
jgi:hypothetical protein